MRKPLFGMMLAGLLCAAGWSVTAAAQDQSTASQEPSLADAARKARAEKKSEPPPKQVWTDDNIPKTPHATASTEGKGEAAAENAAENAASAAGDDDKKKAELEAKWRQKFADAHRKLDLDQKQLDNMQQTLGLKETQYYSDPNTAMREQYQYPSGRGGEINDLKKQIEDKKKDIEKDKQDIADLEDQLRKEGLPPGWARTP